ncbi:hypothetical protein AJ87_42855 [Rhizobium yanglingense]|nr:hypothetical protein AJ87_42855 [Rhizobium yanglingense]
MFGQQIPLKFAPTDFRETSPLYLLLEHRDIGTKFGSTDGRDLCAICQCLDNSFCFVRHHPSIGFEFGIGISDQRMVLGEFRAKLRLQSFQA